MNIDQNTVDPMNDDEISLNYAKLEALEAFYRPFLINGCNIVKYIVKNK